MDTQPLKPVLEHLFSGLTDPERKTNSRLIDCWSEIAGEAVASHTKARFAREGNITVWVDDSTLAFELAQRYKSTLLKRLQNEFGEERVKNIRFFVGQLR